MKSKNNLIELPVVADWVKLRDMYLRDWPDFNTEYNALNNAIKLVEMDEERYGKEFKVFTLNGEWKNDGTFLLLMDKSPNKTGILLATLSDNIDRLMSAVELLDPTVEWYFYSCVDKVKPAVYHYANLNGFTYTIPHPCVFYYLPKEEAVKLEIPERDDVILKPLSIEDAETVNEIWPHRDVNSIIFVKRLITTDFTIGAYNKTNGELMAWCLRLPIGCLGVLQVKPEFLRRGLGKLVTIAQAKQFAENDFDSSATIVHTNTASRELFKSVGFKEIGRRSWMFKSE